MPFYIQIGIKYKYIMEKKQLVGCCAYLSKRHGIELSFLRWIFIILGLFGIGILIYMTISVIFIKNKWILQHVEKSNPNPI